MGTTTFYLKHNDFGRSLNRLTKKELEKFKNLTTKIDMFTEKTTA